MHEHATNNAGTNKRTGLPSPSQLIVRCLPGSVLARDQGRFGSWGAIADVFTDDPRHP